MLGLGLLRVRVRIACCRESCRPYLCQDVRLTDVSDVLVILCEKALFQGMLACPPVFHLGLGLGVRVRARS